MTLDEIEARLALLALTPAPHPYFDPRDNSQWAGYLQLQYEVLDQLSSLDPPRASRLVKRWEENGTFVPRATDSLVGKRLEEYLTILRDENPIAALSFLKEFENRRLLDEWTLELVESLSTANTEFLIQLLRLQAADGRWTFADVMLGEERFQRLVRWMDTLSLENYSAAVLPVTRLYFYSLTAPLLKIETAVLLLRGTVRLSEVDQARVAGVIARWTLQLSRKRARLFSRALSQQCRTLATNNPSLASTLATIRIGSTAYRVERRLTLKKTPANCRKSLLRRVVAAEAWIDLIVDVHLKKALKKQRQEILSAKRRQ